MYEFYSYVDLEGEHIISAEQIIAEYWDYWVSCMGKARHPAHMLTVENCIEDFCIIHWATPSL